MLGIDSPEILEAYEKVRSDKDETDWLLISDSAPGSKTLQLADSGTGGLENLAEKLDDSQVQYGYARVEYANDSESTRVKFVIIVWIGQSTKVMRKARVSIEAGEVKNVLSHHSIQIDASDKSDIDLDEVVKSLRKAGGADYNGGRG